MLRPLGSSKRTALFLWSLEGQVAQQWGDRPPDPAQPVIELIFQRSEERMTVEHVRNHMSHPIHEAAAGGSFPPTLQVLRMDKCRVRTFPRLPLSLVEFYARACDFMTFPDLGDYNELISIDVTDGRIEQLTRALPPNLVHLDLTNNAVREISCDRPPHLDSVVLHGNPRIEFLWTNPNKPASAPEVMGPVRGKPENSVRIVATAPTVYKNAQNAHNSGVQDSTKHNLTYICDYAGSIQGDLSLRIREDLKQLLETGSWLEFISFDPTGARAVGREIALRLRSPYTMHGHQLHTILEKLWLRIMRWPDHDTRRELAKRFSEEVMDSADLCTNGFVCRLANVLLGFDENIVLKLEPRQIIQSRIPATLSRIRKEKGYTDGQEPIFYWLYVLNQTWEDMDEVEMPIAERATWVEALCESLVPLMYDELGMINVHLQREEIVTVLVAAGLSDIVELHSIILNKFREYQSQADLITSERGAVSNIYTTETGVILADAAAGKSYKPGTYFALGGAAMKVTFEPVSESLLEEEAPFIGGLRHRGHPPARLF